MTTFLDVTQEDSRHNCVICGDQIDWGYYPYSSADGSYGYTIYRWRKIQWGWGQMCTFRKDFSQLITVSVNANVCQGVLPKVTAFNVNSTHVDFYQTRKGFNSKEPCDRSGDT